MAIKTTFQNTELNVGDSVRVNYKIKEKDKERIQAFDGILISIKGKKGSQNIIVKKAASDGVSIERTIPLDSPLVDSIKKLRSPKSKIRRAKLYYLRNPRAKKL